MSNVIPFQKMTPEQRQRLKMAQELKLAQRKDEASKYLDILKERSDRAPILLRDRVKIAHGIQLEIERLENDSDLCIGNFSKSALVRRSNGPGRDDPNPTKRLREVTIRGDQLENEKRTACLSARSFPYHSIITSIAGFSRESREAILERIFSGTTVTGAEHEVSDSRVIAEQLNRRLDRLEKVFKLQVRRSLMDIYTESATRKAVHQQAGGKCNWPFFKLDDDYDSSLDSVARGSELPDWRDAYWAQDHQIFGWRVPTCLDWLETVVFLPRYFLGYGFLVNEWMTSGSMSDPTEASRIRAELAAECRKNLDGAGEWRPWANPGTKIVFLKDEMRLRHSGNIGTWLEGQAQMWLVVYPDPERRGRLCPMLYWSCGEGGVHVVVLNWRNIEHLAKVELVTRTGDGPVSLVNHLGELLRSPRDEIFLSWARTATDILDSPFLSDQAITSS